MLRPVGTVAAWLVHLYTASSAVFGLWAVHAVFSHQYRLAIGLMLVTLLIDATDGTLARALDVRRRIPWFDGRRLDDICDYFTYVLVPACFLMEAGILPHPAWAAGPSTSLMIPRWYLLSVVTKRSVWFATRLTRMAPVPLRWSAPTPMG